MEDDFDGLADKECTKGDFIALTSKVKEHESVLRLKRRSSMGIIKDGTVSDVLPSNSDTFAVNYPGYPSSFGPAIETLGGNEGILKARTDKSNNLELHFRPEDPYSHPTFGKLQPCNNFLLKISKKKTNGLQNTKDSNNFSEHEQLSANIVARVSEAYHFNGMVDYQHVLAVHADVNRRKKRNWAEVEPHFEKGGLMDVDQEDLMILLPPLFSTKDIPEQVVLKPSIDLSMKKKPEAPVQQRSKMEIEKCLAIDFNIKEIPKKVDWEKHIPTNSDRWKWQKIVCELFDERPIWVKNSLAECLADQGLNIRNIVLRRLLLIAAYYFSNGPFLRFWIKKGYDPRKDPESRIYQRTDFRVPPALKSYCDANVASGSKNRWEDICGFRVFPFKCQISLQLFELKDEYIQQEIRKPASQGSCNPLTGWFSSRVIDTLRLRVAQRFLSVYPEAGAESFLKMVSTRFEKSKRVKINLKDSEADESIKENKEAVESEDKELNEEVEYDEDGEDEMDDDIDADEPLDLVDQEGSFSLQPDSYSEHENISKDYLQELFGTFPFNANGETQDDDGEYEIFDEDYSDDEDY